MLKATASEPRHEQLSELAEVAKQGLSRSKCECIPPDAMGRSQSTKLWWPVFIPSYAGRDLGVRTVTRSASEGKRKRRCSKSKRMQAHVLKCTCARRLLRPPGPGPGDAPWLLQPGARNTSQHRSCRWQALRHCSTLHSAATVSLYVSSPGLLLSRATAHNSLFT